MKTGWNSEQDFEWEQQNSSVHAVHIGTLTYWESCQNSPIHGNICYKHIWIVPEICLFCILQQQENDLSTEQ